MTREYVIKELMRVGGYLEVKHNVFKRNFDEKGNQFVVKIEEVNGVVKNIIFEGERNEY